MLQYHTAHGRHITQGPCAIFTIPHGATKAPDTGPLQNLQYLRDLGITPFVTNAPNHRALTTFAVCARSWYHTFFDYRTKHRTLTTAAPAPRRVSKHQRDLPWVPCFKQDSARTLPYEHAYARASPRLLPTEILQHELYL